MSVKNDLLYKVSLGLNLYRKAMTQFLALVVLAMLSSLPAEANWSKEQVGPKLLHIFTFTNSNPYDCIERIQFSSQPYASRTQLSLRVSDNCDARYLYKLLSRHAKLPPPNLLGNRLFLQIPLTLGHEGFAVLKTLVTEDLVSSRYEKEMISTFHDQLSFVTELNGDPARRESYYQALRQGDPNGY
jgi:hypothetical protein